MDRYSNDDEHEQPGSPFRKLPIEIILDVAKSAIRKTTNRIASTSKHFKNNLKAEVQENLIVSDRAYFEADLTSTTTTTLTHSEFEKVLDNELMRLYLPNFILIVYPSVPLSTKLDRLKSNKIIENIDIAFADTFISNIKLNKKGKDVNGRLDDDTIKSVVKWVQCYRITSYQMTPYELYNSLISMKKLKKLSFYDFLIPASQEPELITGKKVVEELSVSGRFFTDLNKIINLSSLKCLHMNGPDLTPGFLKGNERGDGMGFLRDVAQLEVLGLGPKFHGHFESTLNCVNSTNMKLVRISTTKSLTINIIQTLLKYSDSLLVIVFADVPNFDELSTEVEMQLRNGSFPKLCYVLGLTKCHVNRRGAEPGLEMVHKVTKEWE